MNPLLRAAWQHSAAITLALPLIIAGAIAVAAPATRTDNLPVAGVPHARHADAVQALREQRYAFAYGRFAELADEGHAPSALIALAMVTQGSLTFGSDWSATPGQLQRWSALASQEVRQRATLITEHDRGE